MFTPFEELEHLAEYLPDEGESVLITRKDGELVCTEWSSGELRDGIDEAALYGLLVQCNEALNARATLPLWATGVGTCWTLAALIVSGGLNWDRWYVVPGLAMSALWLCFAWIRYRQRRLFTEHIRPRIAAAVYERGLDLCSLLAGIRQHAELRTLLDQFAHCPDASRGAYDRAAASRD